MKLTVSCLDDEKISFEMESDYEVDEAIKKETAAKDIQSVLGALARSAFVVRDWNFNLGKGIFIPQKFLKELKRSMLEKLWHKRVGRDVNVCDINLDELMVKTENSHHYEGKISLVIRSQTQLEEFFKAIDDSSLLERISQITLDYEFGKDYRNGVELVREHGLKCFIATTRVLKPGEYHNLKTIKRIAPDGVLIRNLGALEFFKSEALN